MVAWLIRIARPEIRVASTIADIFDSECGDVVVVSNLHL
jgi:hypothetical protein